MSRFWSQLVHDLDPYVPGEQPRREGIIKLNTNELPYGPSPNVFNAIQLAASDSLRRYPDPQSRDLSQAIATYHGVEIDQVFVGNGSDEVLAHGFAALFDRSKPILMPDITYGFYEAYCRLFGLTSIRIPLDEAMQIVVDDYRRTSGGIVVANPNAPTGIALNLGEISELLSKNSHVPVIIDEAYVDFGGETAIPLIADWANLLVVRTMSKSRGLAGLRIGYALGDRGLIEGLRRVKDSFNSYPLGSLAQAAGLASIKDEAYFAASCGQVIRDREWLQAGLKSLGFAVLPSSANFVFCRHTMRSAGALAEQLRAAGIYIRHFDAPRVSDYLRITVGSQSEIDLLLDQLEQLVSHKVARAVD